MADAQMGLRAGAGSARVLLLHARAFRHPGNAGAAPVTDDDGFQFDAKQ